ncbi:Prenylcysteine lyase-domain-containing protein [Podospora appendiculata]|uniref:Prenylcysteine lyase-domain-containing protein n=1 Tax=Podospora appendiculata TaxID=314037 RepID=A0AAE1CDF6_9PEZI|nr:Prenylcysteine lyase-domain-containing protein [Podospora appendiculata]
MRLSSTIPSASAACLLFGTTLGSVVSELQNGARQVAIIGAGAAGSSAASYLEKYALADGVGVNITIFEKTDRIGGRTLTINPFGDPSIRVELGASIFIKKNQILHDSLDEFGLKPRDPEDGADPTLGIWDGEKFVFTVDSSDSFWWNAYKVFRKYGILAPRRTQKLMESTIAKFLKLYEAPHFPFRSLTERAYELDLLGATGVTGDQLLKANNVGEEYAHDIVQASTRVNYASNLAHIHGLDTMVSMAPEGSMAVAGGNWQIFQKMVEKSGASLALNTSVVSINFEANEEHTSERAKYILQIKSTSISADKETYPVLFDDVVIANPFQYSKISTDDGVIQVPIDEIPYVQLHVTIFASPFKYSPAFFGLEDGEAVPGSVLTTLGKDDDPSSGAQGAGSAGFFSISNLRKVVNPDTKREEYLYKIFSPEKVTPEFLSGLFGVQVPDTFVDNAGELDSDIVPISWYYPHVFNSYPKALPRVTFQDPIVGPGVYYTSGMESFISTMETNALMGKNVARLIVDDILDNLPGTAFIDDGGEEGQRPIRFDCDRAGTNGKDNENKKENENKDNVLKTRPTEPVFQDI